MGPEMMIREAGIPRKMAKAKIADMSLVVLSAKSVANEETQLIHAFQFINVQFVASMDISPTFFTKIQTTSREHNMHRANQVALDHLLSVKYVQRKDTLLLIVSIEQMCLMYGALLPACL